LLEAFNEHPLVTTLVLIATFFAAVAGFLSDSGLSGSSGGGSDDRAIPGSTPIDPAPSAPSSSGSGPAARASDVVGSCLDHGGAPTACDGPHVAEVFDLSGDCSHDSLLDYLGGSPGRDVLRTDLAVQSRLAEGLSTCVVIDPSGTRTSTSQDSLLGRSGDVWRRCRDELSRERSCADEHESEVIYEQRVTGEALDCEARADEYLEFPFDAHAEDLELLQDGRRCYIAARGDGVLTHSLRRLGSNALPLTAPSQD